MSSFTTHVRRIHDATLPGRVRHAHLRCCLEHFSPYGFRATYDHLCRSAGISRNPERGQDALVRAAEELHEARRLWNASEATYAARRQREKTGGRRQPVRDDNWRAWQRGWSNIAYCPDPAVHPDEPLPVVIARVLNSTSGPGRCRVCDGPVEPWHTDGFRTYHLCRACGVCRVTERKSLGSGGLGMAALRV